MKKNDNLDFEIIAIIIIIVVLCIIFSQEILKYLP